ncbi:MAG TPA: amidohydrolase [Sporichthyaceae bacterium]|nr:amidohydrolase [Sporichthyaceae bacterium]
MIEPVEFAERVHARADELVALRRDLHAHPELSGQEVRTTALVADRLRQAGLAPRTLPGGVGVLCDVGSGDGPVRALRADLDALPLSDVKDVPYRSTVAGVTHACGHDVHTAAVLGAGLVLAELAAAGRPIGRVRLIFQPAEEVLPGGALAVIAADGLAEVGRILALHCDPRLTVGQIGLRVGPITAACDHVTVRLSGAGGHSARPQLTGDLVHALGTVINQTPAALSRRVDPRAGLSLVWGRVAAGSAANVIPRTGELEGTLRCLDPATWEMAPMLVTEIVEALVLPYRVAAGVEVLRGVPPCVNESESVRVLREAALVAWGPDSVCGTEQSLGGEDFAWYLLRVPGALARLGVAPPGTAGTLDLHRSDFDVDERAIGIGARLLLGAVLSL